LSQVNRLEADKEALLDLAVGSDIDTPLDVQELNIISAKLEVLKRKLTDLGRRAQEAEAEQQAALSAASSGFRALHGHFYRWHFQKECDQARARSVDNVGVLFVEQCGLLSRTTAQIKALEPTATDTEGLRAQAVRLLESVSASEGFQLPPAVIAAPGAPPSASAVPAEPPVEYIFFDPCDPRVFDTQAEFRALYAEGATLQTADAADAMFQAKFPPARFPHLYKTRADLLKMNESLIPPEAGVTWTKVPMIGDTQPAEEQFSHAQ
jgi:hypothetical protein